MTLAALTTVAVPAPLAFLDKRGVGSDTVSFRLIGSGLIPEHWPSRARDSM